MPEISILQQENEFESIDLTLKRLYVCSKGSVFIHLINTHDPLVRQVSIRDTQRGIVISVELTNDDIDPYLARFGIDESVQWWSQENRGWQYQVEIEKRDIDTQAFSKQRSRVYFIFNPERNTLKIGWTRSVDRRLRHLQTASSDKLELLGHIEGDRAVESQFHERFSAYKSNGEWFDYADEVRETIEELLNLRHL